MSFDTGGNNHGEPRGQPGGNGAIWTSSALRRVWLSWFRGYDVVQARMEPRSNAFGEVVYRKRWQLRRR